MKIKLSHTARNQLRDVRDYIDREDPAVAKRYLKRLIQKIRTTLHFPYVGRVNEVYQRQDIRQFAVEGFKVIYQLRGKEIVVLAIDKYIDFDQRRLEIVD